MKKLLLVLLGVACAFAGLLLFLRLTTGFPLAQLAYTIAWLFGCTGLVVVGVLYIVKQLMS